MKFSRTLLLASSIGLGLCVAAPAQEPPRLTEISWYLTDSYCAFTKADHVFDYNDPQSWKFVFLTSLTRQKTAYIGINHELYELKEIDMIVNDDHEIYRYETWEDQPVTVTVKLIEGAKGYEATAYSGHITLEGAGSNETTEFIGDCGV